MSPQPLPLNPPQTPWIDPRTGNVSEPWRRYLLALQNFLSGNIALADYWLSASNTNLPNGVDLGALSDGFLKIAVAAGYATPSTTATIPHGDIAPMDPLTFLGNPTAAIAAPQDMDATVSTALLNAMVGDSGSGGTKGLVPAPAAGDFTAGYFLRADGSWALPPGAGATGVFTTTATGTQDDFDFSGASVLRCNNASDLTLTGLVAGVDGQILTIISVGAGNVFLENEDGGSMAANQLKNIVTSGFTPLTAGSGRATYVYEGTAQRWLLAAHEQGSYLRYIDTPGFTAGDFTGNGSMTWTLVSGDVEFLNYKVVGKQLHVTFSLITTSVGGTPNTQLLWQLPHSWTLQTTCAVYNATINNDNGTIAAGLVLASPAVSTTQIIFRKANGANWTASANNTAVQGMTVVSLA